MGKLTSVSPFYEIKHCAKIVLTLVSIILASIAYAKLKEVSNDVVGVINNWKLKPFTDVYIADKGADCAHDYEELPYKYGNFEDFKG